jgi:hypothetical protein
MLLDNDRLTLWDDGMISFLRNNEFTGLKLKLLLFWTRHPQARFNLDCIASVLNITCHHLRKILTELIDKGMINEEYCQNGITHYSVNHEHEISSCISALSHLDWGVIKNLEVELEKELQPV